MFLVSYASVSLRCTYTSKQASQPNSPAEDPHVNLNYITTEAAVCTSSDFHLRHSMGCEIDAPYRVCAASS